MTERRKKLVIAFQIIFTIILTWAVLSFRTANYPFAEYPFAFVIAGILLGLVLFVVWLDKLKRFL